MKIWSFVLGPLSLVLCLSLVVCGPTPGAEGQEPSKTGMQPGTRDQGPGTRDKFAVIISGVGGEATYAERFAKWADAMYDVLRRQLDFSGDQIFYLTATPTEGQRPQAAKATAEAVRSTFERVKAAAKPDSRIFIFMVGHGSFENEQAKFNLVGPDLAAEDYGHLLDALPTQHIVLVNTASASGAFLKALSKPGRIIITATRSGHERNATMFAEFFIQAFKENQADFDKNDRLSMFEVFDYAAKMTEQWYQQEGRLATEHPVLDDNGDKTGHREATDGDGAVARAFYLDSRSEVAAAGDPELRKWLEEKEQLERSIEALKARKAEMESAAYEAELERLLVRLAQVNQNIKARQK